MGLAIPHEGKAFQTPEQLKCSNIDSRALVITSMVTPSRLAGFSLDDTQPSATFPRRSLFKDGQSIEDLTRTVRGPGGAGLARSFEPIRLVKRGLLWALDNRRLAAFGAGGQPVSLRMATQAEISAEWAR